MSRKLTKLEREAAAVRDATLDDLLSAAMPWDVDRVKEVVLAVARERGEVSANDVRGVLEERLHWLIGPAFNSLTHQRGTLVNTGRRVPSTSPATKGHGISVYRWAAPTTEARDAA
ncbi:hypothetical protein PV569_33510 [Streptomyces scabiei]|uniref:hypothetical protein n=1 Tax=Streptomyces scabiei TaxID=1930 RepID=UPI0029AD638A|nr:hypothetical protein [Streptomyces scabiei]MDX3298581.1 hypothetical protein [Streptomyces scabiei]